MRHTLVPGAGTACTVVAKWMRRLDQPDDVARRTRARGRLSALDSIEMTDGAQLLLI